MVKLSNNYFGLLVSDLKKIWASLGLPQKLAIVVLVVISGVAISYFAAKSTEPNWGVLYSDLNETDAAAVIESLKKSGNAFKLSDDKKTILVPADQKEDLRLMVAEKGVIKDSNPGFELLDKVQLGATDFQNKLTRQRIYQDELTKTIEKIRGIKKARIQLADPERSIFADKEEAPSASVMLILEPGVKVGADQVKAIKNIVAYGIPRLTPERVFISDQFGTPLSEELNNNSSDINDFRSKFENETSQKISKVIEKLVGENNFSVQVSAIMNFDSAKATIERFIPNNSDPNAPQGIVSSEQSESEVYANNANSTQSGAINPAQTPALTQDQNSKKPNYEKSKSIKSFNVSKEVKQVVYAPGTLQRMTVAVAVNKILTNKEKEELRNLILSASGADITRGDIITVTGMQFATDSNVEATKAMTDMEKTSQLQFWINSIGPLLVVLILGLGALFVLNSLMKKPLIGEQVPDSEENDGEDDDEEEELIETNKFPVIESKLEPELEKIRSELNGMILIDPSEAARVLLSYIKE